VGVPVIKSEKGRVGIVELHVASHGFEKWLKRIDRNEIFGKDRLMMERL
jgi:hypothetical protein